MERNTTGLSITAKLLIPSFVSAGFLVVFALVSLFGLAKDASWAGIAVTVVMVLAMVAVSLGVALYMIRNVASSLDEAVEAVKDVSGGNLARRMKAVSGGRLGELGVCFNGFLDTLTNTLGQVVESSSKISFASNTLDATAGEMTRGAGAIVSEVTSVASASEEMASTSVEIARNCAVAAKSSELASRSAVEGESVIQGIMAAMGRIGERVKESAEKIKSLGERSDQVGEIALIINEIADQTNLLALNAAIEAARAGEHGRGFAVVADEVRKLAERTAGATKNIGVTIQAMQSETRTAVSSMEDGVREVQAGAEETEKSGNTLKEILRQVNTLAAQINQIAVASEQQTTTTNEITGNIQRISEIMGYASKNIQDNGNASSQVADLSINLNRLMAEFKLQNRKGLQSSGSPEEAMELVKKAAEYLKTHGSERALREFNNPKGMFTKGSLYIFVNDDSGITKAHGQNRDLVGKNMSDLKDVDGKFFIREVINTGKTKGSGWVDYKWINPATGEVLQKSTYCVRAGGFTMGCGIYK